MSKLSLLLALTFPLCSCLHTSVAPVANRSGVPVVIKIAGAKPWSEPRTSDVQRIIEDLMEGTPKSRPERKYFQHPDSPPVTGGAGVVGKTGTAILRNGDKAVVYFPLAVIKANRPPAECDQAVTQLARQFYDNAKKRYVTIPITELKDQTNR